MVKKIAFFCYQDFANVSTDTASAINEGTEWEARVISCLPHPFNYEKKHDIDWDLASENEKTLMREWLQGVEIGIWAEESSSPNNYYSYYCPNCSLYRDTLMMGVEIPTMFIMHCGVSYRNNSAYYNINDKKHFVGGQLVSPDLWRLTDGLGGSIIFGKPMFIPKNVENSNDKLIITHAPTNYLLKGTANIKQACEMLSATYPHLVEYRELGGPFPHNLNHAELSKLRAECDVYIDQFSTVGGIGMSSFEALADGLLVFCTTQMIPSVAWTYVGLEKRECPIIDLLTPTGDKTVDVFGIYNVLKSTLIDAPRAEIVAHRKRSIKWISENFNAKVVAHKFLESINVYNKR